ncbi:MAG TPA: hypothetical protein VFZ85_02930 [Jiangellaceae bacterium]
MNEVLLSLLSSVVAALAAWVGQWLLRYRRLARKRAFFGVTSSATCILVTPRHFSSPQAASVHRRDTAALVELGTIISECGGTTQIVSGDGELHGVGRLTEFCVGGPTANSRTDAHLRSILRGVRSEPDEAADGMPALRVGTTVYPAASERAEHVVLAKTYVPATPNPVFVLAGQTARSNLAAARFLATHHRKLLKSYGVKGRFCLVLKIVEPLAFGPDFVEIIGDVTAEAFQASAPAADRQAFDGG